MKQRKLVFFALSLLVVSVITATIFFCGNPLKINAEESYQDVEGITVLSNYSNNINLYFDMAGGIDNGYDEQWSAPLTSVMDVVTLNGTTLTDLGVAFQYGGQHDRVHIGPGTTPFISAGDVIVIPAGTTLPVEGDDDIRFVNEVKITFDGTSYTVNFKSPNFVEYEVDSIQVHNYCKTNSQAFLMFCDSEGNDCKLGYNAWVSPDSYTAALLSQITINGENGASISGAFIQGMDVANALCLGGYYLPEGGEIVIPVGAVFENNSCKATFMRTFTIIWNGESYDVTSTKRVISFPEYEMEEGMLSDFTRGSVQRLGGQNFLDASPDPVNWGVNYTGLVSGSFITADEAPEGTTNGGYKFSWETTVGLMYPAIMFNFRDDIPFNSDDEIVFRIYISDTIDMSFNLWIVSTLNPKIWEAETIVSGLSLTNNGWNEIHASISDYLDDDGKIVPIAFVFQYDSSYATSDVPGGYMVFDTATIAQTAKIIDEDYEAQDISEIVPIGSGASFVGQAEEYTEEFNYEEEFNVAFARTDKVVAGVKTDITLNSINQFSFYFVLNGTALYHTKGGVFYWFNNETIKVGTATKVYIDEKLPDYIKAGEKFTVEMMCTPYYVDGIKTGNYVGLKINGNQIGENVYIASANCNYGSWFGLYLHGTSKDVTISLSPVEEANESPVSLSLSTSLNATSVAIGESLGTKVKVTGKIYNAETVKYVVVSGSEYAEIDEDGYITGLADGKAVVKAVVKNSFGEFSSNEIEITIGTGETAKKSSGCGSAVSMSLIMFAAAGLSIILKKQKNN